MTVDFSYQLRKDDPGAAFRDLDDVAVLEPVVTDDGDTIAVGTEGTIVGVWKDGEAFFVEFAEPDGALATVRPAHLRRTGRHAPRAGMFPRSGACTWATGSSSIIS